MARLSFTCTARVVLKRMREFNEKEMLSFTEAHKYKYSSLANTSQSHSLPDINMLFPVDTERPGQTHSFVATSPGHRLQTQK